jgi:hypothetical protein
MKKAGIVIMVISIAVMILFTIIWFHPVTDNVVDSDGFWAYMYGASSNPWPVFAGGVVFLMGLLMFMSGWEQKSQRVN